MSKIRHYLVAGIVIAFVLSLTSISYGQTPKLEDPILEYSYHVKVDLSEVNTTVNRILSSKDMEPEDAAKLQAILEFISQTGLLDVKDTTIDLFFEGNKIKLNTQLNFYDSLNTRKSINGFINSKPIPSVVRTMIPDNEPIFWLTVMDPDSFLAIFKEFMSADTFENITGDPDLHPVRNIKKALGIDLFQTAEDYFDTEWHFVIYDANIKMMDDFPQINAAFISAMDKDMAQNAGNLAGMIDRIFVEKYGATKSTQKWHNYDMVSFEDFGCPAPIKFCYIVDKNYAIFATDPETLTKTAEFVLTPSRTASAKPPVMNGMMTININKIINKFPPEMFSFLEMTYGYDPHQGKIKEMIQNQDWGIIKFTRTHKKNGIELNCEMNRDIYALLFHISRETMVMGFREEFKYGL